MTRFADPLLEVLTFLRAKLPGVRVENRRPDGHEHGVLQVSLDGNPIRHPLIANPVLRVTAWEATEGKALDLAWEALDTLLGFNSGSIVAFNSNYSGPVPGTDPDNGDQFSTFVLTARQRPTPMP